MACYPGCGITAYLWFPFSSLKALGRHSTMITIIIEEVIEPVAIQGEINYGMSSVMDDVKDLSAGSKERVAAEAQHEGADLFPDRHVAFTL